MKIEYNREGNYSSFDDFYNGEVFIYFDYDDDFEVERFGMKIHCDGRDDMFWSFDYEQLCEYDEKVNNTNPFKFKKVNSSKLVVE